MDSLDDGSLATLTPSLIERVAAETRVALTPLLEADWSRPALPDGEWSCWQTGEHLADSYFAHAARIVGRPTEWFVPAAVRVDDGASPAQVLQVVDTCAELLRQAGTGADPASRAYHPWGTSEPEGSIAMGAVEGLVHTWDISTALGGHWHPPASLCAPAIERLFPDAPNVADVDAGAVLLWCTGRVALADHPRRTSWRWYSAVRD